MLSALCFLKNLKSKPTEIFLRNESFQLTEDNVQFSPCWEKNLCGFTIVNLSVSSLHGTQSLPPSLLHSRPCCAYCSGDLQVPRFWERCSPCSCPQFAKPLYFIWKACIGTHEKNIYIKALYEQISSKSLRSWSICAICYRGNQKPPVCLPELCSYQGSCNYLFGEGFESLQ